VDFTAESTYPNAEADSADGKKLSFQVTDQWRHYEMIFHISPFAKNQRTEVQFRFPKDQGLVYEIDNLEVCRT